MIKNRLDYKLINVALIAVIVYLIYNTGNLWLSFVGKLIQIITPFFFAFIVAYALYPMVNYLQSKRIPKFLSVVIVLGLIIGLVAILIILIVPLLFGQLTSLFNGIIAFLKELTVNYDLNLGSVQDSLSASFNDIIMNLSKYVSNGAINVISMSLGVISTIVIAFAASIYLLIDMAKIRNTFKQFLLSKSKRAYTYFKTLDTEMKNYLTGFMKIVVITLFEYTIAFLIIGHPNAILLGFLAAVATLIPYFGGMITNVIAAITAFVISPTLFIKTVICFFILSSIDGYVINPFVYGKTNEVHPLVVIFAVFTGGILFGIIGIIISLPLAIAILATYKFYKNDINEKIEDIKFEKKKKRILKKRTNNEKS